MLCSELQPFYDSSRSQRLAEPVKLCNTEGSLRAVIMFWSCDWLIYNLLSTSMINGLRELIFNQVHKGVIIGQTVSYQMASTFIAFLNKLKKNI